MLDLRETPLPAEKGAVADERGRVLAPKPETLMALYGGQGTINVPSWRPDGGAFAYVDYARP